MIFLCMNYTWRMQIIGKANELLHADFVAEIGALICKVYKEPIVRNTWLPVAWSIPGKGTLFERETNVFMQLFLQKLELEFASFISKKLGGTLDILLHEVYLQNADYLKGKLMFSCRSFCRNLSSNLQVL